MASINKPSQPLIPASGGGEVDPETLAALDEVESFASRQDFPVPGAENKLYIARDTNEAYLFSLTNGYTNLKSKSSFVIIPLNDSCINYESLDQEIYNLPYDTPTLCLIQNELLPWENVRSEWGLIIHEAGEENDSFRIICADGAIGLHPIRQGFAVDCSGYQPSAPIMLVLTSDDDTYDDTSLEVSLIEWLIQIPVCNCWLKVLGKADTYYGQLTSDGATALDFAGTFGCIHLTPQEGSVLVDTSDWHPHSSSISAEPSLTPYVTELWPTDITIPGTIKLVYQSGYIRYCPIISRGHDLDAKIQNYEIDGYQVDVDENTQAIDWSNFPEEDPGNYIGGLPQILQEIGALLMPDYTTLPIIQFNFNQWYWYGDAESKEAFISKYTKSITIDDIDQSLSVVYPNVLLVDDTFGHQLAYAIYNNTRNSFIGLFCDDTGKVLPGMKFELQNNSLEPFFKIYTTHLHTAGTVNMTVDRSFKVSDGFIYSKAERTR